MGSAVKGQHLKALRGTMSQQKFIELLETHGFPEDELSRQRLSRVEKGEVDLPPETWEALIEALLAGGRSEAEVESLWPEEPALASAPPNTPEFRRQQWLSLAERLPRSRWWRSFDQLVAEFAGPRWLRDYQKIVREIGFDQYDQLTEAHRLLRLGGTQEGRGMPVPGDAIALAGDLEAFAGGVADRTVRLPSNQVFLLRQRLANTGTAHWRDRMLYRVGPLVTASTPFVPPLLPVPATAPGDECEMIIPGRAQFLANLAMVSYVMVFPDCSVCLPGRLTFCVDTRTDEFDPIPELPPGFETSSPH